jgi:hypothetical protein
MSKETLGNFGGYLDHISTDGQELTLRFISWNAYDEDILPVLLLRLSDYSIGENEYTFEEVKENNLEVDGIEIDQSKVTVWVYGYDNAATLTCSSHEYEFQNLNEKDLRRFLAISREDGARRYKESMELKAKIDSLLKFMIEQENRISLKKSHHANGTKGNKLYAEQLKLLKRLTNRLEN